MSLSRRYFIKKTGAATALVGLSSISSKVFSKAKNSKITILHTNDFESQFQNFNVLEKKISEIRTQHENVLLFDSGDFIGKFSKYQGEAEYKLIEKLKYNAIGLGNNEFYFGSKNLANQISTCSIPILSSNYTFLNSDLSRKVAKTTIIHQAGIKIGIFSLNQNIADFNIETHFGTYLNPIEVAEKIGDELKIKQNCELVICLSHLGHTYSTKKVSDIVLAKNTSYIDLILGGHTHTNLEKVIPFKNKKGTFTYINQAGSLGNTLGNIELMFEEQKVTVVTSKNYWLNKQKNIELVVFKDKKVKKQ